MFEDVRNSIDFFIRNKTRFSRKNFRETSQKLIERNCLENLYTRDVLEQFFEKKHKNHTKILDVGCKNWFYVKGEHEFFKSFCEKFNLDGVEIDPFRLYSNFYSRYETAKFYMSGLENANYICGNFLDLTQNYDYIIWFLPFVLKTPHRMWGLPDKYFCPKKMLKHAYGLLNEDGQMLIVNQGEVEAEAQKELFASIGLDYTELGEVKSEYFEYMNKRFAFLVKK